MTRDEAVEITGMVEQGYAFSMRTDDERFWSKVDIGERDDCWKWTAYTNAAGYGMFFVAGTVVGAHRISYQLLREAIPDGLCIDHLCRVRDCVNPWHMEVVTRVENIMRGDSPPAVNGRKIVCVNGHDLVNGAVSVRTIRGRQTRVCLVCERAADAKRTPRKRGSRRRKT